MTAQTLNVLIIGCGNIAGGFDMSGMQAGSPQTHAGAYTRDPRFSIVACVEPNTQKRHEFCQYWGISQGFDNLTQAELAKLSIDIISVCSPTHLHKEHVLKALDFMPKLIFCEKPITPSFTESQAVLSACEQANVALCINHNRRWDPEINDLKSKLKSQTYGSLRSIVGYYNKGALNNGSHLIDTLHYLVGDLKVIATGTAISDGYPEDPSVPALLTTTTNIPIHLVTSNAEDYSLFQLQFIFSEGILTMLEGGQNWSFQAVTSSKVFPDYNVLKEPELHSGQYHLTTIQALDNIYHAVISNTPLTSSGATALEAQKICEQLTHPHDPAFSTQDAL